MISLKKNEIELANEVMSKISLTKDKENLENHVVNLSKCIVNLSKKANVDIGNTKAKVITVLDYSGSMEWLYASGTIQNTINRLVPLGLTFDDNGALDVYLFQNDYRKMKDITLSNYKDYVEKVINKSGYYMGGTNYAPVLEAIINNQSANNTGLFGKLFKSKKDTSPQSDITFVLFITDGDNSDKYDTNKIIVESAKPEKRTFVQFIGIGGAEFNYLEELDNLEGRALDNTGFSKMVDLEMASDIELYNNILEQFAEWLKLI